jgi:hypothetical protein
MKGKGGDEPPIIYEISDSGRWRSVGYSNVAGYVFAFKSKFSLASR